MTKFDYNERLFDSMLEAAFSQNTQELIDGVDWSPAPEHVFSKAHDRRMQAIFNKYKRQQARRQAVKVARRAAVVILVIMAIAFAGLMSVEAIRKQIVELVLKPFDKFTRISYEADPDMEIDLGVAGGMIPSKIPEGYVLEMMEKSGPSLYARYINEEGYLLFYQQMSAASTRGVSIDNENRDFKNVMLGEYEALVTLSQEDPTMDTYIIWSDGIYIYSIDCSCTEEEIIEIAKSLEPVDYSK